MVNKVTYIIRAPASVGEFVFSTVNRLYNYTERCSARLLYGQHTFRRLLRLSVSDQNGD